MKLKDIYETIPYGSQNGIRMADLCQLWELRPRAVRRVMAQLNLSQMPVCNVGAGYYRPVCREELLPYIKYMASLKCRFETKVARLKRVYGRWDQQKMPLN